METNLSWQIILLAIVLLFAIITIWYATKELKSGTPRRGQISGTNSPTKQLPRVMALVIFGFFGLYIIYLFLKWLISIWSWKVCILTVRCIVVLFLVWKLWGKNWKLPSLPSFGKKSKRATYYGKLAICLGIVALIGWFVWPVMKLRLSLGSADNAASASTVRSTLPTLSEGTPMISKGVVYAINSPEGKAIFFKPHTSGDSVVLTFTNSRGHEWRMKFLNKNGKGITIPLEGSARAYPGEQIRIMSDTDMLIDVWTEVDLSQ